MAGDTVKYSTLPARPLRSQTASGREEWRSLRTRVRRGETRAGVRHSSMRRQSAARGHAAGVAPAPVVLKWSGRMTD